MIEVAPFLITLKLALLTTVILLLLGIPLAYFLAYARFRGRFLLEALVALPLVLPPSVLGFYLLISFNKESYLGRFLWNHFELSLAFSFSGLVVGSIFYSLPFMVQPLQSGFQNLPPVLKEASYTLGKGRWETLRRVLLPNIKPSLITGIVLTFAHTIGEFGVVLLIGGNLDETRVASIAIYDSMNQLDYSAAHTYSLVLLVFSFLILSIVYLYNKRGLKAIR